MQIYHLGNGTVYINGMDFEGTARLRATGLSQTPRNLDYKGLFNIETASASAVVTINDTYGEFTPDAADNQINGLRVMDCDVVATNLAHSIACANGGSIRPTWFGGWNQDNTATIDGYTCEVTGTIDEPTGALLLIGEDGNTQPTLELSSNSPGSIIVYAEWDFFRGRGRDKVVWPLMFGGVPVTDNTHGEFEIDSVLDARRVTATLNVAFGGGTTIRAFQTTADTTPGEWRIGNRLIGGSATNGVTRGPDEALSELHGVIVGGCADFTVSDFQVSYAAPALLTKDTTDCIVEDSVTRKVPVYAQHLVAKGATDSIFRRNECYLEHTDAYEGGGIRITLNDYGNVSTGHTFQANDIYVSSASFVGTGTCGLFKQDAGCDATMTGNRWIMQDAGSVPAEFDYNGLKNRTFAQYLADIPDGTDTAL